MAAARPERPGAVRRWVFDASPLIALGKAGLLGLPVEVGVEGLIPEAAAAEVAAGDEGDPARAWLMAGPPFEVVPAPVSSVVAAWGLGAGETAPLSYALGHPGVEAVLDERAARACAEALGVGVRGTLGLLVLAKREGAVSAVRPHVDALLGAGYHLGSALVAAVLDEAGEG